jgi:iron complex outermembrane receptor protein
MRLSKDDDMTNRKYSSTNSINNLKNSTTSLIYLASTLLSSAAIAASTPSGGIEEVTVVAQKREVNIQKAPVAITAVSAQVLDQSHAINPVDLNGLIPSLVFTTSEGFNNSVAIRGIGFNVPQNDAAQPSVSYHIDNVYIANPVALNTGFLDPDHIEVLRGPQGTVFGQNSVGGTINVISKLPTFDGTTGYADLSLGTYNLETFRGALNTTLGDSIAVRASIAQDRHDGFGNATQVPGTGGKYDLSDDDSVHGRLQGLWKPNENFSLLLRAEYAQLDNNAPLSKSLNDPNPDPWTQTSDWPGFQDIKQQIYSATATYNLPWATVKSLSSWQASDHIGSLNEDGLTTALMNPAPHDVEYEYQKSMNWTQEINLSSLPGGKLDWIVGAFFLTGNEKVGYTQWGLSPSAPNAPNYLFYKPPSYKTGADLPASLYFQSASRLTRTSYSFYGQGTYHLSDSLRITGGIRQTHDENSTDVHDYFDLTGPPVFVKSSANSTTGKGEVEYDLAPDNLIYASYSTGFKPGGGNISLSPAVVPFQYKPETVTAYEIGTKNAFMDKRIRLNAAAFYYDYSNMQFEAEDVVNFQGGVDNIPKAEVYGAEAEATVLLPANLRLDGNLTVEKGRITSHFQALDNVAGNYANFLAGFAFFSPLDLKLRRAAYRDVYGNSPPMMPKVQGTVSLTHTWDMAGGAQLISKFDVQYRDAYNTTIFPKNAIYTAPSYTLYNLFFGYTFANDKWDMSFSLTNLTNAAAVQSRFVNQFGGETTQTYFPPRQAIFRVGYRF